MNAPERRPSVLIVSLGSTAGLRASDDELAASLERAGARVTLASARRTRAWRTLAATDLAWALSARRAAAAAISRDRPDAVVYSTITAALLAPAPGAIRLDALNATNRLGRHGIWQRPRERGVLARAPLLLAVSDQVFAGAAIPHDRVIVVPIAVAPSGPPVPAASRDIAAITYAANPAKKGLDRVLAAWARARRPGEELVVAGVAAAAGEGVRCVGLLERDAYRALLRRARVYISASRREEYGIAQLEALVDGAVLVATEPALPYPAVTLARSVDPRLVGGELAGAIRLALDAPRADYAAALAPALAAFTPASVDRVVAERVLPALTAIA